MNNTKKSWLRRRASFFVLSILFIAILFTLWSNYKYASGLADGMGVFGDLFGASNALFSGLAFVGIIYTIILQSEELKLQRNELKETRAEFSQQNRTMELQSFENTFFKLLETQDKIRQSIINRVPPSSDAPELDHLLPGKKYFHYLLDQYHEARRIISRPILQARYAKSLLIEKGYSFKDFLYYRYHLTEQVLDEDNINAAYIYFFREHEDDLGHYFRHGYHLLKFIFDYEIKEIEELQMNNKLGISLNNGNPLRVAQLKEIKLKYRRYADFVQAQLSSFEIALYLYNCLVYPKAKKLAMYYGILENLSEKLLYYPNDISPLLMKEKIGNIDIAEVDFWFLRKTGG